MLSTRSDRECNFLEVSHGLRRGRSPEGSRTLPAMRYLFRVLPVRRRLSRRSHRSQPAGGKKRTSRSVRWCFATGADVYDPAGSRRHLSSTDTNPNVLTSLEFERILSASGPTMGHLVRPSDEKEPKKIAWLQCVGSRDTNRCGNGYCCFGLLHVCHQGCHDRQGALRRRSGLRHLLYGHPHLRQGL